MTNLIAGYTGAGSPPSPWTALSTFDGKYLKNTSTLANHGVTGGNLTHTHTTASSSIDVGNYNYWLYSEVNGCMGKHTHGLTVTCGNTANDPTYRTIRLIKCDLTTWETTERCFPVGTILFADAALSWAEVDRDSTFDNRLIKIDNTANTNGGNDTETDAITITIANADPGEVNAYIDSDAVAVPYDQGDSRHLYHGHTLTHTPAAQSTKPARIRTRVYKTNVNTTKALAGVICFVDSTPSSKWTAVNWDGYFIEGANEDDNATGSNTHTPNGLTGADTSSWSYGLRYGYLTDSGVEVEYYTHHHHVTFTFNSADMQPPYVQLYPVKLNTTLYAGGMMISACLF